MSEEGRTRATLIGGCMAAILASMCCLGPLVLVTVGISGAWISSLTALERFRPLFVVLALACLYFAYRRIFRSATECPPTAVCSAPLVRRGYKMVFAAVAALVALAIAFPRLAPLFY